MKQRKIMALLFAGLLFISLTACRTESAGDNAEPTAPAENPPINGENNIDLTTPDIAEPLPTEPDEPLDTYGEAERQEQLESYLSELFNEAFEPHYEGLHYRLPHCHETIVGDSYTATFTWTMFHLGNGLNDPNDYGTEQFGNYLIQATAKIMADGKLDMNTVAVLVDNSMGEGLPKYEDPLDIYFSPPPATPPIELEIVQDYVQTYLQLIAEGDPAELGAFVYIDGGVTDSNTEVGRRVIEYYLPYDISGASVQRVYYFEIEEERQFRVLVRDGQGEMFVVDALYADRLVGIDVRIFE